MLKRVVLAICFAVALLFCGCIGQSGSGVLSPSQVDSSMVDQVLKVKGKITLLVENPGGLGGLYLKLGDSRGEVSVRVQPHIWDSFDKDKKAEFKEGRTLTAEGMLFQAGNELVVVMGKYSSSNATSTNTE